MHRVAHFQALLPFPIGDRPAVFRDLFVLLLDLLPGRLKIQVFAAAALAALEGRFPPLKGHGGQLSLFIQLQPRKIPRDQPLHFAHVLPGGFFHPVQQRPHLRNEPAQRHPGALLLALHQRGFFRVFGVGVIKLFASFQPACRIGLIHCKAVKGAYVGARLIGRAELFHAGGGLYVQISRVQHLVHGALLQDHALRLPADAQVRLHARALEIARQRLQTEGMDGRNRRKLHALRL